MTILKQSEVKRDGRPTSYVGKSYKEKECSTNTGFIWDADRCEGKREGGRRETKFSEAKTRERSRRLKLDVFWELCFNIIELFSHFDRNCKLCVFLFNIYTDNIKCKHMYLSSTLIERNLFCWIIIKNIK